MKTQILNSFLLTAMLILGIPCISITQSQKWLSPPEERQIETYLDNGDWQEIYSMFEQKITESKADSNFVFKGMGRWRLLFGHAALATGNSNIAYGLFAPWNDSLLQTECVQQWHEWTEAQVQKNSNSPNAYYLLGDALARLDLLPEAVKVLDKAIELYPKHKLAYNARGVVKTLIYIKTPSRISYAAILGDFGKAIEIDPFFSDAYSGKTCLKVLFKSDQKQVDAIVSQGLKIDSTNSIIRLSKAISAAMINDTKTMKQYDPFGTSFKVSGNLGLSGMGVPGKVAKLMGVDARLKFDISKNQYGGVRFFFKIGENIESLPGHYNKSVLKTWFGLQYPCPITANKNN